MLRYRKKEREGRIGVMPSTVAYGVPVHPCRGYPGPLIKRQEKQPKQSTQGKPSPANSEEEASLNMGVSCGRWGILGTRAQMAQF